jgi:hypothetical protein
MVNRVIESRRSNAVLSEIKPQLAGLLDQADHILQPLEHGALTSKRKKQLVGIGVYVFSDKVIDNVVDD